MERLGTPEVVVGRDNGVVGLTGFSDKKMSGLLFGPQKVVVLTGWSYTWRGSTVVRKDDRTGWIQMKPRQLPVFVYYSLLKMPYFLWAYFDQRSRRAYFERSYRFRKLTGTFIKYF